MPTIGRFPDTIRLAIFDAHPPIREGIRHATSKAFGMTVVAETGSAPEALRLVDEHSLDVAVTDLTLGDDLPGVRFIEEAKTRCPDVKILVYSMYDEVVYAERAFRNGASGYLMKGGAMADLLVAVRHVATGRAYLSPAMTARVLKHMREGGSGGIRFPIDELTNRERQVFRMLGQGLTTETIADRLDLTRKTVETHRRRAKVKFGYNTVDELVSHATRWVLGTKNQESQPKLA